MKKGLIIGKFMPLHQGHITMIHEAAKQCSELHVLLGALKSEPIPGSLRLQWMQETFRLDSNIIIHYTEEELPTSSQSSREVSKVWAGYLKKNFPQVQVIFSSEHYGEYLGEYMNIESVLYDLDRNKIPISATQIRSNPLRYWDFIADAAKPYFVKKICIFGPESTGKSILAQRLADYFKTQFVPEMAREIIGKQEITFQLMPVILQSHANEILRLQKTANRLLFCDTDHLTTLIYSLEFFKKTPPVEPWIEKVNHYDLYLFADIDTDWVEDHQRFFKNQRAQHRELFLNTLKERNLPFQIIKGHWENRFQQALKIIKSLFPYE